MAEFENTKKTLKGLKPIEAGFVRYFEMIEEAFKQVNKNMGSLQMPDPTLRKTKTVKRSPNRPVYMDNPMDNPNLNSPFAPDTGGNIYG
jgi:hypothetical protein